MNTRNRGMSHVLISFACPYQALLLASEHNADFIELPLDEFKYVGDIMRMPSIVILNSYCNVYSPTVDELHYEIFYHDQAKNVNIVPNFYKIGF
jgi:hypothetical protein